MEHKQTLLVDGPVVDPLDTLLTELADLQHRYENEEPPPLIARRMEELQRVISWARAQFKKNDRDDADADAA